MGTRARNFASRKLLASSSPVDTQLFIHIRATSSYSSARAGRMIGDIGWNPGVDDRQETSGARLSRGPFGFNRAVAWPHQRAARWRILRGSARQARDFRDDDFAL